MSKQTLSILQMQHLQELGLEMKETMLYWARCVETDRKLKCLNYGKWYLQKGNKAQVVGLSHWEFIPAYTLQDVLDALPKEIKYKEKICWLSFEISDEHIGYYYNDYLFRPTWVFDEQLRVIDESIIDAAYKLLCRCIENGYVETNKNE